MIKINVVCLLIFLCMLVLLPSGCSKYYERERPIPQLCKDLGKWDCR